MDERMWEKLNWNELSKFRSQIYGIAMVWIVIYHVWESFPEQMTFPWTLSEIVSYGNIGVDIFLFLSGISMYFAVKKEIRDGGFLCIRKFYYKRISKIAIVYVLFCVPYFVFMHLIWNYDLSMFLKQLFFCREKISSFWFLLCIVVCYLLYPLIYQWIAAGKKRTLCFVLGIYIVALFVCQKCLPGFYIKYEILLSRIPVFTAGAICGEKVFHKETVSSCLLAVVPIILLSRGPVFYVLEHLPFYQTYMSIFSRLYGSLQGVGCVFLLIMIFKYIEDLKIFKGIGFLGTFTTETYVAHIAVRNILIQVAELRLETHLKTLVFLIPYVIVSFVMGYGMSKLTNLVLQKCLNSIRQERDSGKRKEL